MNDKIIKWLEKKFNHNLTMARGMKELGKEDERWFYMERARTILILMNELKVEKWDETSVSTLQPLESGSPSQIS